MKNKILSVKRVFIFSLVIFVIYFVSFPKDGSPPNQTMVTLGAISFCLIVICGGILLYRSVTKKNSHSISNNPTNTKNLELEKHRACFGSKTMKSSNSQNIDVDDRISYDSSYFVDGQNEEFKNFENDLKPIWDGGGYSISFEYINARGNKTKREILLNKVLINSNDKVYFLGYCLDNNEDRTFKVEGILFPIEYAGQKYSVARFLTQALGLEKDYVKALDF